MALTDLACRKARIGTKDYTLPDENGLALVVKTNGTKLWNWSFRFQGAQGKLSFGTYPETSLSDARGRRTEGRQFIKDGIDPRERLSPSAERKAFAAARHDEATRSFAGFATDWFAVQKDGGRWAEGFSLEIWRTLERHVLPTLGKMAIDTIEVKDVLQVLRAMEQAGLSESVRKVRGYISAIFRYAKVEGAVKHNPATDIQDALAPRRRAKGHPSLAPDELPEFFATLARPHSDREATRIALRVIMHAVLRSSELRRARWEHVIADELHLPEGHMKRVKGESVPHIVPLSRQTLGLLDRMRELTGGRGFIFPGARPGKPISENAVLFSIYGMGWKGRVTNHGFRTTFSTYANESGEWDGDWIEMQLAHMKRGVRGIYNKALYLPQRKRLMQWWSDFLDEQEAKAPKLAKPAAALSEAIDPELAAMLG